MGYTHYWRQSRRMTDDEWSAVTDGARKIVDVSRRLRIRLAGPVGDGEPVFTDESLSFNGSFDADEDYETFYLTRGPNDFSFCKTARNPYDAAVVAVLIHAHNAAPDAFSWSSDGSDDEHIDGRNVLKAALG